MIKRQLSNYLIERFKRFPLLAVLGPRGSGKTTLIKNTFPDYKYLSFEDISTRELAFKDPKEFLSIYNGKYIFSEIQRVPELLPYIESHVDSKKESGQYILISSYNFLFMKNISRSLVEKIALIKLLPYSHLELDESDYKFDDYNKLLFKGFYPNIYDKNINPVEWYLNYIQNYIERDIKLIKNITDTNTFEKFIRLCAGRIGQVLNLSSLGNDCGVSHNTIKAWITILEESFIIFLLKPHWQNYSKRLIKMPKLYFYDTGLACSLLKIKSSSELINHYSRGNIFESFIISDIIKTRYNAGIEPNCFYWRDKMGHEINCLIELKDTKIPIEIKSGKTINNDFFKNIKYWNKLSKNFPKNSYIIYGGDKNLIYNNFNIISWKI